MDTRVNSAPRAGISHAAEKENMEIPLPPLDVQRRIVTEIEAEQTLVEANRKLAEIFEKKIQAKPAEIWGEEATNVG